MVDIIGVLLQWVLLRNPYGCAVKKKKLVEKLHKPVTWKFEKWKLYIPFIDNIGVQLRIEKQNVYLIFIDNIWGTCNFANM